ncbi:MAG TPA: dihydrolipoyllysine-residue acetyltransferase [Rhodanobacteraceae bacterium]|nr:dihydrolipoyllysine-residue acetyltransferase [Rhodanobacteraceae bacterium]
MAVQEARVPDIGNYTDVPVIEVLVKPGDTIEKDQGLITLESDKATMEVPAPFAGVVKEVKLKVGDEIAEGAVIALIDTVAEGGKETPAGPAKTAPPAAQPEPPAAKPEPAPGAGKPVEAQAAAPATATPSEPVAPGPHAPPVPFDPSVVLPDKVPYASPAVRLFARELGADLAAITGTGRKGRIMKEDVQNFVKRALSGGTAASGAGAAGGLQLLPWPQVDFAKFGEVESVPLSRINRIAGANLARNWAMIPHVTQHDLADVTGMEAFRRKLGEEQAGKGGAGLKITPLVFLIKAVVAALRKYPRFNASLDASGESLVLKKYFHIGIAVDTPDGLVVPVIRDCDRKGLLDLARELGEVSAKARDRKLGPADMSGGCFSISSLGGIGGTAFTPIVNAPEVAILGVSKSRMQPVWNGRKFAPRLMLPLSLSYDHRVIDGAAAARFTTCLAQTLGDLRRLLL